MSLENENKNESVAIFDIQLKYELNYNSLENKLFWNC